MESENKPQCDVCGSTNMAEQPGDIFPGLLVCQEPDCKGIHLTDAGAQNFDAALSKAYIAKMMHVSGNN